MKRKKVSRWIILLALVLSLVSGCASKPNPDNNNLDHYAFSANYKQVQNCEWGKKAAVYQEQIYYSDPASGGIFRMDLDGGQCQLVLGSPDVRKFQLSGEGIHFLGFVGNGSNRNGEYRSFRLFLFDWITKETQNLMETSWYAQIAEGNLELWDFYRTEQGTIANINVGWGGGNPFTYPSLNLYYTSTEGEVSGDQFSFLREFTSERIPSSEYPGSCEVSAYDQLYFSAESQFRNIDPMLTRYSLPSGAFSVTDRQRNQLIMNTDTSSERFEWASGHRTIDSFLPDGVLVHIKNEMMLMTSDFQDSVRSVLLEGEDVIRFVVVSGENAYIIAEKGSRDKQLSVYEMNLETFAHEKLYTCAKGRKFLLFEMKGEEQILWLDAKKLVTAQGQTIRIWALKDGEYELNRTLETSQNVVAKINKTDVAGDWLFVYQFSEENNRDELIEKLNIAIE